MQQPLAKLPPSPSATVFCDSPTLGWGPDVTPVHSCIDNGTRCGAAAASMWCARFGFRDASGTGFPSKTDSQPSDVAPRAPTGEYCAPAGSMPK